MDDSFGQWREGRKPSSRPENRRSSVLLSESENDSMSHVNNRRGIVEASDSDDEVDMFSHSRASAKSKNKSNLSDDGVPESDVATDLDETTSSVEEAPVRNGRIRRPKQKIESEDDDSEADESYRSDEENNRSRNIADESDTDAGSEDSDYSDDEDGDASGPAVRRRSKSILNSKDKPVHKSIPGTEDKDSEGSEDSDYSDDEDEDPSGPAVRRRSKCILNSKDKPVHKSIPRTEDKDDTDPETPIVRKNRKKIMILDDTMEEVTRESERHSIQTSKKSISQDNSLVIENTESTDESDQDDDASGSDEENASASRSRRSAPETPVAKEKPIRRSIFNDLTEEDTDHRESMDAQTINNSNGLDAVENAESMDGSYRDDDASESDEDSDSASGSRRSSPKKPVVTENHGRKKMIYDDSEEEDTHRSEKRVEQTNHDSKVFKNTKIKHESRDEDDAAGFVGKSASKSGHNGEHLTVKSPVGGIIGVDRSAGWPVKEDKSYVTISDTSDSDDKSNAAAAQSANSSSNLTDEGIVASIAKKEVGVGNVDPFIAQKRAILTCNIEQVQSRLAKSKMILHTANISLLPDKGEKLRRSINNHEAELRKLSEQLESLPKLATPKVKVKKEEPIADPVAPPAWKHLPGPVPIDKLGQKALETHEREQALTIERLEDLHGSLNARPGEDERAEDPKGLKVSLMPHQQHALAWLMWREKQRPHGGILADDMGLGKTLTMISLILKSLSERDSDDSEESDDEWVHRKKSIRPNGGTLVVCPASLLSQWEGEINRRCKRGLLSVELFHGNRRESVPRRLAKFDVVITTYNLISREYKSESPLYNIKWKRVILDEAHIVRNPKSQASEAVCNLLARNRWALTGTPIQNKELDLYALLKFLKCSPFDDLRVWKRWVDNKNAHGHERLATVMKTLMLRRTKVGLQALGGLGALPDKNLEEIHIQLDPEEQLVYEKVLVFSRTLFAQFLHQRAEKNHMFELGAGKFNAPTFLQKPKDTQFTKVQNELLARHADVKAHEILVLLLRLRQVCCHPALIHAMLDQEDLKGNDIEDEGGVNVDVMNSLGALKLEDDEENIDPNEIGVNRRVVENLLTTSNPVFDETRQSSKIRAVLNTIQTILDKGDKIVVVSQWTSMLEVVRGHLKSLKGATYDILSGNVPVKNRQQIVEGFNKVGASPQILLLSLTAGGVGLNLVGGNHLLLLDIHWNPQLEAQAQDRIYRVGQTKSVYIYKFMCLDTVEQRIKALQDKKLEIAHGVLTGAAPTGGSKLTMDDLKSLFSL